MTEPIKIFNDDGSFLFPIDGKYYRESDYLRTAIKDEKVRWLANLVTHYRHNCIASWNRCWGRRGGAAYRAAANFGDYDEEKAKVNERAKRQLIRKCYPIFLQVGIEVNHFAELQNTDWETIALANKYLEGKVEMPAYINNHKNKKEVEKLTDKSPMPFGAHKGKPMVEVPANTLLWYYNNFPEWNKSQLPVKNYIVENMDVLKSQIKK